MTPEEIKTTSVGALLLHSGELVGLSVSLAIMQQGDPYFEWLKATLSREHSEITQELLRRFKADGG